MCNIVDKQTDTPKPGPSRFRRHWLVFLALLAVAAGLLLVAVGASMPAYTDSAAAERIKSGLECIPGVPNPDPNRQCPDEIWQRSMSELRTIKWILVDQGGALLVSGLTMCVFAFWSRGKSWRQWSTPRWKLAILVLAALAWLVQFPVYFVYFIGRLTRDDLPHWADSISIPMGALQANLLQWFLPYMAIWSLFVIGARLPVRIFSRLPGRPLVNAFWTGVTAVLFVLVAAVLVGAVLDGPVLMLPFLWLTLWLLLCARAAALTRHRPALENRD
jgi:hypothetical protein